MESSKHIDWIDGLKGMLALVVVMSHLRMAFAPVVADGYFLYRFPISDLSCGGLAVPAFICLSAIVMTLKSVDSSKWQQMFLKRYFRLALPIAPIILLYVLFWCAGLLYNVQLSEQMDNWWLISHKPNLFSILKVLLTTPFGNGSMYVNVVWMLAYIFATPFVVVILDIALKGMLVRRSVIVLLFCSLIAAIEDPVVISIFAGYGIARYILPSNGLSDIARWKQALLLCMLVVLYVVAYYLPFFESGRDMLRGVILVFFVLFSPICKRIFSVRPMVWLGKISFEVYLLHLFVIFSLACWMYMYVPYFPHRLMCIYGCTVTLTILVSWIWSIVVNKPLNRLLSRAEMLF